MRALTAVALLFASAPALAFAGTASAAGADDASSDRRICTRIERYGGSRLSYQRVCLTPAEWRERLGPDWRQRLAGRDNIQDDMDAVEVRSRSWSDIDSEGISTSGGGGGGGPPR